MNCQDCKNWEEGGREIKTEKERFFIDGICKKGIHTAESIKSGYWHRPFYGFGAEDQCEHFEIKD